MIKEKTFEEFKNMLESVSVVVICTFFFIMGVLLLVSLPTTHDLIESETNSMTTTLMGFLPFLIIMLVFYTNSLVINKIFIIKSRVNKK